MERNIFLVENDRMVTSDTLENIVRAANIAGYMEKEDKIDVPDDQQLMQCIVFGYNTWDNLQDPPSWDEFIEAKLLETFGPQRVFILVEKTTQCEYTDHYGEEAKPTVEILGTYSTREAAEKEKQDREGQDMVYAEIASDEDLDRLHNQSYEIIEQLLTDGEAGHE